jgi:hypothetical protein
MVKTNHKKKARRQQAGETSRSIIKITPDTGYEECSERLTAFGGLLALVKFLDLIGFEGLFAEHYRAPQRQTQLGHCRMISGIVMLLFIGFQRLGHFAYLRSDSMLCGALQVGVLPAVSTFWRYLQAMGLVQAQSLLRLSAALRRRVWQLCGYAPRAVQINIDTMVSTVYGAIDGARKGHNRKHRGKKALRPVLCFVSETREYLCGTQRRGQTMSGAEVARQIRQFRGLLPACVEHVAAMQSSSVMKVWLRAETRGSASSSPTRCALRLLPNAAGTGTATTNTTSVAINPAAGNSPAALWPCAFAKTSGASGN